MSSVLWLAALSGCPDRSISAVYPEQGTVETIDIPALANRNVDILFVIDNSLSMEQEQASLRANFSKFMDVLATIEGGIPNVHIGVTTSNMGQSAEDGVGMASFGPACAGSGDDGAMRTVPGSTARFLVDVEAAGGTRSRNYSGTLADAFSEMANVGTQGCGIEQHLGAAERALTNVANSGFLRDDAKLAVIFIQDEDDCSLEHTGLFEGSTDGTVVNFRCTQEGIECDGGDISVVGAHTNCRPKENSAYLAGIDRYVEFFKSLKALPDEDVIMAGIVGDPSPVQIGKDDQQRTILQRSCTYGEQFAMPAVRTASFLGQFPSSIRESICTPDLSDALVQIGATLKRSWGDPCWEGTLEDMSPADGVQAECTVSDYRKFPDGSSQEIATIPACGNGQIPCWRIEEDSAKCYYTPTAMKIVVDRGGALAPADTFFKASCVTTDDSGPVQ